MAQKWNLQDIKVGRAKHIQKQPTKGAPINEPIDYSSQTEKAPHVKISRDQKKSGKKTVYIILSVLLVIVVFFFVKGFFGGATVTIYPKFENTTVQSTFIAYKESKIDNLSYELMSLDIEGERQIKATGREEVTVQSRGEITIFKDTKGVQELIINTRFESPEGLIFKIDDSVVVPGAVENEAGELIPGSITVTAYAAVAGEEYNISSTKFTIPGFKGNPEKFNSMYGETTQFSGGFDGERFILNSEELEVARNELQEELKLTLLDEASTKRPSGFVLFDQSTVVTFEELPSVEYGNDIATIKERAYLYVPLFKEDDFASFIAKNTTAGYEGESIRIDNPTTIKFSYDTETTDINNIAQLGDISFSLNGAVLLVWTFDTIALKNDLTGVTINGLPTVLGGYPSIGHAKAVIKPFWKKSFPDDAEEIELIEIVEDNED